MKPGQSLNILWRASPLTLMRCAFSVEPLSNVANTQRVWLKLFPRIFRSTPIVVNHKRLSAARGTRTLHPLTAAAIVASVVAERGELRLDVSDEAINCRERKPGDAAVPALGG